MPKRGKEIKKFIEKFKTGEIVLAHVKGYPFWPGTITQIIENSRAGFTYKVEFFGTYE